MKYLDIEIKLTLNQQFTSIKTDFEALIQTENLTNANLVCWVPHEVGSIIQIGWEDGLLEDLKNFLLDVVPPQKWTAHDEPGTPFRHNFYQHIQTKLIGTVSLTLIVKNHQLYLGKYQDLYYYSPVYKVIPQQKIFCRILKLD